MKKTAVKKTATKAAKKTTKKVAKKTAKKAVKKAAKKTVRKRTSRAKAPIRMKLVWAVGKPGLTPTAMYAYPDKSHAERHADKLGEGFMVMKMRVTMEDPPEEEEAADAAGTAKA